MTEKDLDRVTIAIWAKLEIYLMSQGFLSTWWFTRRALSESLPLGVNPEKEILKRIKEQLSSRDTAALETI